MNVGLSRFYNHDHLVEGLAFLTTSFWTRERWASKGTTKRGAGIVS